MNYEISSWVAYGSRGSSIGKVKFSVRDPLLQTYSEFWFEDGQFYTAVGWKNKESGYAAMEMANQNRELVEVLRTLLRNHPLLGTLLPAESLAEKRTRR